MTRTASLTAAAALLSLMGTAHAAELLSSPLWSDVGNAGICIVRNVSTAPVAVRVRLFSNNGFNVDIDDCNGTPLGPGKTCSVFSFDLPDDSFVECSARTSDVNAGKLRGSVEIRRFATPASNGTVVVSETLR
jgi:hypothetical protein